MEVVNSAYESVALMFVKDVVEHGLTLREVAHKYHYCAGTVSSYIKKYVDDPELLAKYKEAMKHNKTCHNTNDKHPDVSIKVKVEDLPKYYHEQCQSETPFNAINSGKRVADTTWEVAEREYKKWREGYMKR